MLYRNQRGSGCVYAAGLVKAVFDSGLSELTEHGKPSPAGMSLTEFPRVISRMAIDFGSPQPIYKQICEMFRAAISAGDLPPGLVLPTTHKMAAALKVTRNTVATAYSRLVAEGYLVSNTRRGTRVAEGSSSRLPAIRRSQAEEEARPLVEKEPPIEVSFRARRLLELDARPFDAEVQLPDSSLYPRVKLGRLLGGAFHRAPNAEPDFGVREFQIAVTMLLRHYRDVRCEPEQVIPVQSLENAIELSSRALIDPGHCAYVENPTDPSVWRGLRAAGAELVPIPSDEYGADITQVSAPPPRLIYVTPSVGVPLGRQMSEARRADLLEAARRSRAIIFECDRCSELLYGGRTLRPLQNYDRESRVLYFGSLRESLGLHLKAAYLVVPSSLVNDFDSLGRQCDYGPEPFVLGALGKFLQDVSFVMHLKEARTEYSKRLSLLFEACRTYLRGAVVFEPLGGLMLSIRYPEKLDEATICSRCSSHGIAVAPLSRFYHGGQNPGWNGLVLGIGTISERIIETVVKRLAEVIDEVRSGSL